MTYNKQKVKQKLDPSWKKKKTASGIYSAEFFAHKLSILSNISCVSKNTFAHVSIFVVCEWTLSKVQQGTASKQFQQPTPPNSSQTDSQRSRWNDISVDWDYSFFEKLSFHKLNMKMYSLQSLLQKFRFWLPAHVWNLIISQRTKAVCLQKDVFSYIM